MKTKTLYVIIFVLAIIAILAIVYGNKKIPEPNQPVLKENRAEVKQPQRVTQAIEPVFFPKQAITIIKPAQQREQVEVASSSGQSSSLANGSSGSAETAEAAAGITRVGKYPTKEKIKEMNSKGIIMY